MFNHDAVVDSQHLPTMNGINKTKVQEYTKVETKSQGLSNLFKHALKERCV